MSQKPIQPRQTLQSKEWVSSPLCSPANAALYPLIRPSRLILVSLPFISLFLQMSSGELTPDIPQPQHFFFFGFSKNGSSSTSRTNISFINQVGFPLFIFNFYINVNDRKMMSSYYGTHHQNCTGRKEKKQNFHSGDNSQLLKLDPFYEWICRVLLPIWLINIQASHWRKHRLNEISFPLRSF